MRPDSASITQKKIEEKLAEIMLLEQEIKKIHVASHSLIYDRENVEEPLNTKEYAEFMQLNRDYQAKKDKLDSLKAACNNLKQIKRVEDLKQEALEKNTQDYLTKQERTVLIFFNSRFPDSINSRDIRTGLNLSKGCVYAHLRSFLIAKLITHNTDSKGVDYYLLTNKGKNYLERSMRLMYIKENFGI